MALDKTLNIDECALNRDWLHVRWDKSEIPPYKSKAFFKWLNKLDMTLTDFKLTGLYLQAVADGLIIEDQWMG